MDSSSVFRKILLWQISFLQPNRLDRHLISKLLSYQFTNLEDVLNLNQLLQLYYVQVKSRQKKKNGIYSFNYNKIKLLVHPFTLSQTGFKFNFFRDKIFLSMDINLPALAFFFQGLQATLVPIKYKRKILIIIITYYFNNYKFNFEI